MIKPIPITKTTFTLATGQGKDIYSPIQKLIVKNKMPAVINRDKIEFSTYNQNQVQETLSLFDTLKAKFKMNSINE